MTSQADTLIVKERRGVEGEQSVGVLNIIPGLQRSKDSGFGSLQFDRTQS